MGKHALVKEDRQHRHGLRARRLVVLTVPLLGIAGVASASGTFGGPGSDIAGMSAAAQLTVHQTDMIAGLAPGGKAQPLSGSFDNRSEGVVIVANVTAKITGVTEAADVTGTCDPADFAITGSGTGDAVPTGDDQGSWSGLSLSLTNTSANQDACKNAVPLITYTVS